ncbi:MAG: hypothetical protein AAB676_14265 [Verrucomicrobiota bacterium]
MKAIQITLQTDSSIRGLLSHRWGMLLLLLWLASLALAWAADKPADPKSFPAPKRVVVPKLSGGLSPSMAT